MTPEKARLILTSTPQAEQRKVFIKHGEKWTDAHIDEIVEWSHTRRDYPNSELYILAARLGRRSTACLQAACNL